MKLGPYRLLRKIAVGGMAEVWEAERTPGERVALKTLTAEGSSVGALRKLMAEAQLTSALVHPNIVRTLDVGSAGGRVYLVMELLQGRTLAQLGRGVGPLPVGLVLGLSRQLLAGLAHAHGGSGLVHRDIKPSNLFVTEDGIGKVIDFGIAVLPGVDRTQTRTGVLRGSLPYCSPEQVRNETLDVRADLFSFGLVMQELLTGGRVFSQNTDAAILSAILWTPVVPLRHQRPELAPALSAVVEQLLEKDVLLRSSSAAEVAQALENADPENPPWGPGEIAHYLALHPVKVAAPDTASAVDIELLDGVELAATPSRARRLRGWAVLAGTVGLAVGGWAMLRSEPRRGAVPAPAVARVAAEAVPLLTPPLPVAIPPPHPPPVRHAAVPRGPPGWLTVGMKDGWANVKIDGKAVGPTPLFHLPLAAGRHAVEARRPDGVDLPIQHVVIESAKEKKVALR